MAEANILTRYNRQELIKGWEQSKLKNGSVTVVGTDLLGQYTIIPLTALGIGNIRILGNEQTNEALFLDLKLNGDIATSLEKILNKINPDVDVIGLKSNIVNKSSLYFLKNSDVIIDTTNDPTSKALVFEYCQSNNIPMFSMGCDENFGRMIGTNGTNKDLKFIMPDLEYEKQGELISLVMGGLVTEEIKKIFMGDKEQLEVPLYYNFTNQNRFSYEKLENIASTDEGEFVDKEALLIGAGALGNFVGLGLAKLGVKRITIMDDDDIEDTNLNRQILYYDSVGAKKAETLAKKLKKISKKKVDTLALVDKFKKNTKLKTEYDVIFDCVDNFETRLNISNYAVKKKIPLVSGGTDFEAGQVAVYVPKKTSSVDYQLNLREKVEKAKEERSSESCIYSPDPSVIMTNQIIGGIMLGEARTIFNPDKYGAPINGILKYGSNLDNRLGVNFISKVEDGFISKIVDGVKKW